MIEKRQVLDIMGGIFYHKDSYFFNIQDLPLKNKLSNSLEAII